MIDLQADHVGYVVAAYGIVTVVLVGLLATTLRRAALLRETLAKMKLSDVGQKDEA